MVARPSASCCPSAASARPSGSLLLLHCGSPGSGSSNSSPPRRQCPCLAATRHLRRVEYPPSHAKTPPPPTASTPASAAASKAQKKAKLNMNKKHMCQAHTYPNICFLKPLMKTSTEKKEKRLDLERKKWQKCFSLKSNIYRKKYEFPVLNALLLE